MNQELKKEILKLCREQQVVELQHGERYEIQKGSLRIQMDIKSCGATARFLSLTVKDTDALLYRREAYIPAATKPYTMSLDQLSLWQISLGMSRKAQCQKFATGDEYRAALHTLSHIREVFGDDKTKSGR